MPSQNDIILDHLKKGNTLTPLEALSLCGCWSLSSRISDLKRQGNDIMSQLVERNGKWVAKYFIIPEEQDAT